MSEVGLGFYDLIEFTVSNLSEGSPKSLDIKEVVGDFNIMESMDTGYLQGSAQIQDSQNIIQNFPLNGEEKIKIRYKDWFGEEHTDEMFLYAIDNIQISKSSGEEQTYTIHFCSIGRFLTATQTVRLGFDSISTIDAAESVFERYFKGVGVEKELEVDSEQTHEQRLVIPAYEPIEAMNFLARKSVFSDSSMIDNVRFFENREKYWFAGSEFLALGGFDGIKETAKFIQNSLFTEDPGTLNLRMSHIQNFSYLTRVNTMDDMKSGIYRRNVIEYDINTKEMTETEFNLVDEVKPYFSQNQNISTIHTKNFIEGYFVTPSDDFRIKDWTSTGVGLKPDTMYSRAYGAKISQMLYETRYPIEITVFGRNKLFAGDPVEIVVMKAESGKSAEKDEERSGHYLAYSINNQFNRDGVFKQTIRLIRPGVVKKDNQGPAVKGVDVL